MPETLGEAEPKGTSLLKSSYSSVSVSVVTRRSKSLLFPATPSTRAKIREPDAGVPRVKKSASAAGAIDPSVPQAGTVAVPGLPFGSLSIGQRFASIVKALPVVRASSST